MADYEISTRITADSSSFTSGINKAKKSTSSLSDSISGVIKDISGGKGLNGSLGGVVTKLGLVGVAVGATTKAIKKTIQTVKECSAEYSRFESGQRVLAQTLKVTGAQEWTNIDNLKQMQQEISKTTNYSTGEIQQLQTVLLGFKSIKGDVFDQTTDAILDMATVMGMDLTSATQTVAKALDDPIKGLGSLSRQGFVFTEQQKALIQSLVDSGKQFEAQKIILEELQTTYGGASRKAVDASTVLKNQTSEFKKALGAITNPVADGWDIFWTRVFDKGTKTLTDLRKTQEELGVGGGRQVGADLMSSLTSNQTALIEFYDTGKMAAENQQKILEYINKLNREDVELYKVQLGSLRDRTKLEDYILERVQNRSKAIANISLHQKKQEEAQNKVIEKEQKQKDINDKIAEIKKAHNEAMEEQERKWKAIEQVSGKQISIEEKIKAYTDDLVSAVVEANGGITEGNEFYKERIKIIEELRDKESEVTDVSNTNLDLIAETGDATSATGSEALMVIQKIKEGFKKVIEVIRKIISAIKEMYSAFYELTKVRIDDLTDRLLEIEDNVLTFFLETLPQLPGFIRQIVDSVIQTASQIDFTGLVSNQIDDVLTAIIEASPEFIDLISDMTLEVFYAIANSIIKNSEGLKKVLKSVSKVITKLINLITKTLLKSDKLLGDLLGGIVELAIDVIDSLIENLPDLLEGLLDGIIDGIEKIINAVINWLPRLVPELIRMIPKIINMLKNVLSKLIEYLPELILLIVETVPMIVEGVIDALFDYITEVDPFLVVELGFAITGSLFKAVGKVISELPNIIKKLVDEFFKLFTTEEGWNKVGNWFTIFWSNLFGNIGNAFNSLFEGLKSFFDGIGKFFQNLFTGGGASMMTSNPIDVGKLVRPYQAYATGSNNVKSGIALVGEAGPELIDFKGGERVYNNSDTKKILNSESVGNNFNVTFNNIQDTSAYEMMRQLKQYNRQMAINGVL